ncbi:Sec-independent protein secretion pathway component [Methanocella conradii HZ254]|uniref:Sec-independent protein secretion pathway component n=1 Tax=Methanocella conradii (strain DSM 24694 / JCM 17849 / CGMCC 1.5162 / HZ254) TaxID=1041930 RepID=H8I9U3_METCZ|nr:twin-arginine translocase TatA/TatE family subunit [Methanocella conradii]AFD00544.1 Sec-independent protein secretion pathway component [Methanocella conradii HZ254]MDI6896239.1 twin-arginine translocase TatA/TatE family subunit [Methanocella conradii]
MVGFDEIIFIAIVALLLFGPDKLPEYIRELGRLYAEVKKAQRDLEAELNKAVQEPVKAQKPPSPTVAEIARKMGISVEGKAEDQLLKEIDEAITSKSGKV